MIVLVPIMLMLAALASFSIAVACLYSGYVFTSVLNTCAAAINFSIAIWQFNSLRSRA